MKITHDDVADMGLNATAKLVELGYIPDCTDTDDEDEFEVQDAIREAITEVLERKGLTVEIEWTDTVIKGIALQDLKEKLTKVYIDKIREDLFQDDDSLLYALLMGEGMRPVSDLSLKELEEEAIEEGII